MILSSLRCKIHIARSFSIHDWQLLFRAWLLLLVVDWRLRRGAFASLQAWAKKIPVETKPVKPEEAPEIIRRTRLVVDIASRRNLYPMTCLRRSLVLQRLLGSQGLATELCIGAYLLGGKLRAHAWLEYQGAPIGERQAIEEQFILLEPLENS
jgi:hypothetical protein